MNCAFVHSLPGLADLRLTLVTWARARTASAGNLAFFPRGLGYSLPNFAAKT